MGVSTPNLPNLGEYRYRYRYGYRYRCRPILPPSS